MENELTVYEEHPLSVQDIKAQVSLIQEVMKSVMKEGEHFGKIPGCGPKPSLLKPGAEKLSMTFRMAPKFEGEDNPRDLGKGHREYIIKCSLYSIKTGRFLGEGVGSCSTMEAKYRYRTGPVEFTGKPVPSEYWKERDINLIGGKGFVPKKNPKTGKWEIAKQGETVENDNPADQYNTVLKMAKKRAHVDAILTATAASDIFTQDIEEMAESEGSNGEQKADADKPEIQRKQTESDSPSPPKDEPILEGQKSALEKIQKKLALTDDGMKDRAFKILGRVVGDMDTLTKADAIKLIGELQKEK